MQRYFSANPAPILGIKPQEWALILLTLVWGITFLVVHLAMQHSGKLEPWALRLAPGEPPLQLPTVMICNNMETRVCFALQGLGIAYLPDFSIRDLLADSGRLCGAYRRFPRAVAREQTSITEGRRTGRFSERAGVSRCVSPDVNR